MTLCARCQIFRIGKSEVLTHRNILFEKIDGEKEEGRALLDRAVLFNWQFIRAKYNHGAYTGVSLSDSIVTSMI